MLYEFKGDAFIKSNPVYPVKKIIQDGKPMEHEELTEKIIGCAYKVYNKMGFGFLESVYEKCLMIELKNAGLKAEHRYPSRFFTRMKMSAILSQIFLWRISLFWNSNQSEK